MGQQWHIKITEKKRKEVDRALLLQAILALAKHMEAQEREQAARAAQPHEEDEESL